MADRSLSFASLRRDHPVFFWGTLCLLLMLIAGSTFVAIRIPTYRREAAEIDRRMDEEERATRDRILDSQTRRSELALALLQREMRLKALEEKGVHLAISSEDSTLSLKHGPAILREIPITIGGDSIIRASDGREWRLVSALGERHVAEKDIGENYTFPEWLYISRGQAVPPEADREMEGGLGRYVLRLDDGTEIYSRPSEGPFAEGVKPGAFVVEDEGGLRAIFDAITIETPVFIF